MNLASRPAPGPRPSRRRGTSLRSGLLVVLLAASLLNLVPPGMAQSVLGEHVAEVQEDGTDSVLVDLEGDAMPYGVDVGASTPAGEAARYVDVLDLRVGHESVSDYGFTFRFAGWDEPEQTVSRAAIGIGSVRCSLEYMFNDRDEFLYRAVIYVHDLTGADASTSGYMERQDRTGEWWMYEELDRDVYEFSFDAQTRSLDLRMQKAGTPVYPSFAPPAAGDDLQIQDAYCYASGLYTYYSDDVVAPQDFAFSFLQPGSGDTVKVFFGEPRHLVVTLDEDGYEDGPGTTGPSGAYAGSDPGAGEPAWLTPGVQTVLPFHLVNTVDQKRIVALEASVLGDDGEPLTGWNLTAAPHLELKAEETRSAKLIVTPPAAAALGESVLLVIDATVVGRDELGRAARQGDLLPRLSPEANQLFFHARPGTTWIKTGQEPADWMFRSHDLGWSLLRDDPEWSDEPVRMLREGGSYGSLWLPPLPSPTKLDPEGDVEVQLAFRNGGEVEVELWIGTGQGETLFRFRDAIQANGPITIKRAVPEEIQHRLAAGTTIFANLYYWGDWLQGPMDTVSTGTPDIVFDPSESHVKLPLVHVSTEEVQVTDGRFVPSLALVPGQDSEEYMNPGKAYTFDLMLANEGIETDDLVVDVDIGNATSDGWIADVVPGNAFRVSAGNATKFGVRLAAPPDAQEQDVVEITVRATSTHDERASATLRLGVIVTAQLEVPEKEYEEDEDQIAPLRLDTEESPSIGLATSIGILALAGLVLRRRR